MIIDCPDCNGLTSGRCSKHSTTITYSYPDETVAQKYLDTALQLDAAQARIAELESQLKSAREVIEGLYEDVKAEHGLDDFEIEKDTSSLGRARDFLKKLDGNKQT